MEASTYGGKKLGSPSEHHPVRSTHPKKPRSKTRPVLRKNLLRSKTGASAGIPAGDNGAAAAAAIPQAGVRNPALEGVRAVAEGIGEGNLRPPLEFEVVKNLTTVMIGDTVRVECGDAYYQLKVKQDSVLQVSVARNKELAEEDVKLVDSVLAELPAISERHEWISIPEDYGEDELIAAEALLKFSRALRD